MDPCEFDTSLVYTARPCPKKRNAKDNPSFRIVSREQRQGPPKHSHETPNILSPHSSIFTAPPSSLPGRWVLGAGAGM